MVIEGGPGRACVDENVALDFVQGRLAATEVRRVDDHADGCARCRVLLDEAVRSFRDHVTMDGPAVAGILTVFRAGDVLSSRYRIVRFIARGGMGEVYEAEDLVLGTRVALKTMNAAISDDPDASRRLKQEVNLARRITHENVCRIFDIGVHEPSNPRPGDRVLFLTMELIEGMSLGDRIRADGPLPVSEARPIMVAMLAALGAAHRAGVVHRDFKSDNVMVCPRVGAAPPRVVVMDFGLARDVSGALANSSQHGSLAGTLAYMAPEQLEGKPTSPATDVYAVGIVMFEMLSGRLPFAGEQPVGAALQRLVTAAPALGQHLPGADPACEALIARCLERDPTRRPASVDDVARALHEGRTPVGAPSLTPPRRPPRARWRAWGVGAGVVAAIAIGYFRPSTTPRPGLAPAAPAENQPPPRAVTASPARTEGLGAETATPLTAARTGDHAPAAAGHAPAQARTPSHPPPARTVGDRPGDSRRLVAPAPSRRAAPADPEAASGNGADSLNTPATVPRSRDPIDGFIFPRAAPTGRADPTP